MSAHEHCAALPCHCIKLNLYKFKPFIFSFHDQTWHQYFTMEWIALYTWNHQPLVHGTARWTVYQCFWNSVIWVSTWSAKFSFPHSRAKITEAIIYLPAFYSTLAFLFPFVPISKMSSEAAVLPTPANLKDQVHVDAAEVKKQTTSSIKSFIAGGFGGVCSVLVG